MLVVYAPTFSVGVCGNICVLAALFKDKELRSQFYIYLANTALSDLLFMLLSTFNCIEFMMEEWIFGDFLCRAQSVLIEVTYSVSAISLSVLALERYLSICRASQRQRRLSSECFRCAALIWLVALVVCSPQGYSRTAVLRNETGLVNCRNTYWSGEANVIYFSIQMILLYVIPLGLILHTHYRIFRFLRTKVSSNDNEPNLTTLQIRLRTNTIVRQRERNKKVYKLLSIVTTVFLLLWTPFMVVRLMLYANVSFPLIIWRVSQLLLAIQAAANFFIYALASTELRKSFISLFSCLKKT